MVDFVTSGPITSPCEAVDDAVARERDQLDRARLPGLEAHRGAGGDVQPEAGAAARSNCSASLVSKK